MARLSYDAWGQARNAQTWSGPPAQGRLNAVLDITRAGYTGHEMLWASGTVHMNGRVYDAGTGRMISADPTIPRMWDAQTHNRYAYVYNNPLSLVDPTGFSGEFVKLDSQQVFGSADDRRDARMHRIEQEAAAYSAFKRGPLSPSDHLMAQRLLDLMRLNIEAALLQQEVYAHPGSRLNKLRQQRADRARARARVFANGAVTGAFAYAFGRATKEARQEGTIYVTGHRVGKVGPYHLAIEYDGQTLSAGPVDGLLFSEVNRAGDEATANLTIGEARPPAGMSPGAYFSSMQQADLRYCDCVDYDLFPGVMNSYNSNSYVHGLINATGGTSSVDFNRYYGGPKPLPPQYFGGP